MVFKRPQSKIAILIFSLLLFVWGIAEIRSVRTTKRENRVAVIQTKENNKEHPVDSLDVQLQQMTPGTRILQKIDLDKDTAETFASENSKDPPGKVCGNFVDDSTISCIIMLARTDSSHTKLARLIFIKDVNHLDGSFETIEDYSSETRETTNGYIVLKVKSSLRSSDGDSFEMPRDGVMRVFDGQSAVVFYYLNGVIQKVWISD